jgi:hypothetical protein
MPDPVYKYSDSRRGLLCSHKLKPFLRISCYYQTKLSIGLLYELVTEPSSCWTLQPVEMKTLRSFETSGTNNLGTEHHPSEYLNPEQVRSNVKSCTVLVLLLWHSFTDISVVTSLYAFYSGGSL